MQHDLGPGLSYPRANPGGIPQILDRAIAAFGDTGQIVKIRAGFRRQGERGDLRSEAVQPERQPGALEPGLAGHKNPLGAPETGIGGGHHTFHGASPLRHSDSRSWESRRVSIGCQNPSWR